MKAKNWLILWGATVALCLLGVPLGNAAPEKPIEISYANFFPPTHIQSQLPESW